MLLRPWETLPAPRPLLGAVRLPVPRDGVPFIGYFEMDKEGSVAVSGWGTNTVGCPYSSHAIRP